MSPNRVELAARQRYEAEIQKIAERLRQLGTEVGSVRMTRADGRPRSVNSITGEITTAVLHGVANLRLDMLSSWAQDIEEARDVKP